MVMEYFQTYEMIEKYNSLDKFYRNGYINLVDAKWGKKADDVKTLIDAIPAKSKDDTIRYQRNSLNQYYKLDDIKQTKDQMNVIKKIEELAELQSKNEKTLEYFNLPYEADRMENELITILQVAMSL